MLATTEFPEWQREYWRLLRREKYTYERDYKNRLVYYAALPGLEEKIAGESDTASEVINRLMVEQATASCTEDERELLHLVFFERRTMAEISRSCGIPYRTLGYRLDRTLRKCRRALQYRHVG